MNLSRDEIARQIHFTLRQLYPEKEFDSSLIHRMIVMTDLNATRFVFPADHFASVSSLQTDTFVDDLYRELGIEFEKNWHDKSFFTMTKRDNTIIFEAVAVGSDDRG